jgi:hypothetical protein
MAETKNAENLDHLLLSYEDLQVALENVKNEKDVPSDLAAPLAAFRMILEIIINLIEKEVPASMRSRFRVGLLKETASIGNTSVSMGGAGICISAKQSVVCFINGGTGGNKYQIYACEKNVIRCVYEFKGDTKSSPNAVALPIKDFKPAAEVTLTPEQNRAAMTAEIEKVREECALFTPDVPIYAFITGTARGAYERASTAEQEASDTAMREQYQGIAQPLPGFASYFLPASDECKLESEACNLLYTNAVNAGCFTSKNMTVIGSAGTGKGSTQVQHGDKQILHAHGMTNLEGLRQFAQVYETEVHKLNLGKTFEKLDSETLLVLALKSGFAIYPTKKPAILRRVVKQ